MIKQTFFLLLIIVPASVPMKVHAYRYKSISRFALSFDPLGFAQFGPIVHAELGVKRNLALNVHVRYPTLGLLSRKMADDDDGLDDFSADAFGVGLIYFAGRFNTKLYVGILADFQKSQALYAEGEYWEWSQDNNTRIFIFNIGLRFLSNEGFFVNTGLYLGFAQNQYEWEYTNRGPESYGSTDYEDREGLEVYPVAMFELAFGLGIF